ncbi:hypothetical protein BGW37DRAFT_484806 [Umbelopsis sp. PMI_123]|nr:hypothetical protein BGW37DRAFT_484806 [Umbelopsis sp. PMI_123]
MHYGERQNGFSIICWLLILLLTILPTDHLVSHIEISSNIGSALCVSFVVWQYRTCSSAVDASPAIWNIPFQSICQLATTLASSRRYFPTLLLTVYWYSLESTVGCWRN